MELFKVSHQSCRLQIRGAVLALIVLAAARSCANHTYWPDRLVSPLLVDENVGEADAIVVLGASVVGACSPGDNGIRRVLTAARLWRERRAPYMLITGGSGPVSCPVAQAMAGFAYEIGIPRSAVRLERESTNTRENAAFGGRLLRGWGARRILLVTDRLHLTRARSVFIAEGFDVRHATVPIYEGHDDNVAMLVAGLREYAALGYYRLRGWLTPQQVGAAAVAKARPPAGWRAEGPIVLLGASYALGWKVSDIAGVPVLNRGAAGQQSFELRQRFESDVVSAHPRAVILWGFINDIFRTSPAQRDAALARVRESYTQMVALARQHGIVPILATEVTARPSAGSFVSETINFVGTLLGKEAYQDGVNRSVIAANQWIRELAMREGLLLLDFEPLLAQPDGRRIGRFAQPDGSHITEAGYSLITAYATPIVEESLVGQ